MPSSVLDDSGKGSPTARTKETRYEDHMRRNDKVSVDLQLNFVFFASLIYLFIITCVTFMTRPGISFRYVQRRA